MFDVIQTDPEVLSGIPVFKGTRVLIKNLFDYFEAGDSIDEFLDDFPSVSKDQVLILLKDLQDEALRLRQVA